MESGGPFYSRRGIQSVFNLINSPKNTTYFIVFSVENNISTPFSLFLASESFIHIVWLNNCKIRSVYPRQNPVNGYYREISAGLQTQICFSDMFAIEELLTGAVQHYPPVLQNEGAVGSFQSMLHVLLDKQDSNTLVT